VRPDEVSKPDKVLFRRRRITKLDLAEYYAAVAPAMVPLIHGRPLNLQRYPDGLGGKALFTQQAPKHFPDWIARATVPKKDGTVDHAVVERAETLVYLAGQACLTVHAWTSRRDRLDRPDRLVIDFDPQIDDFDAIRDAAGSAATCTASAASSRSRWSRARAASTSSPAAPHARARRRGARGARAWPPSSSAGTLTA
jgi:bifunctional non-homologous end joining protein LigD